MIKKTLLLTLLLLSLNVPANVCAQEMYNEDGISIVVNSNELGTGYFLSREDIVLENYTEYFSLTTYEEKRVFSIMYFL